MNKTIAIFGGAGLGAGAMYLIDPDRGKRRRALVKDQAARSARKTREAAGTTARDAKNRTRGLIRTMKSWLSTTRPVTDDVLVERVRSKLGMLVRHPRSIEVCAQNGTVTLSGPVLADEVEYLLGMVSRVSGVSHVDNRLEMHEEAGNIPGLQGSPERRPRGEQFELMQSNWSPTARALTGAAGSAMAVYGARQRSLMGAGMAALGVALFARGLTNREYSRWLDIDWRGNTMRDRRNGRMQGRRGGDGRQQKQLREVMTSGVEVIHPDASLQEAAGKMKTLDVGAIPVCDGDRLVGMLTDRDIVVRTVAEKRDPNTVAVRDAMTPEVTYCFEDDHVQEAAMLMVERRIRRLVVLNREKRLVGIVSLGDLTVHTQNTQLGGEVLEYVSEPAQPRR